MALSFRCFALTAFISLAPLMAEASAGCPTSHNGPPRLLQSTETPRLFLTSASQARIWKTITVGEYKGVNAVRAAIDASPCPIRLGESADEILGRPAFQYAKKPTQLDLTVVSVLDLGFDGDGATLREIYARALGIGLELCPAEAGPILRLTYLDQPIGEFLNIAMHPIPRYDGGLVDLSIGNGGAGLVLIGGYGGLNLVYAGRARFVFVRPRQDQPPSLPDDELVAR